MTKKEVKQLLRQLKLPIKKRLGQHYLIDPYSIRKILKAAKLSKSDIVLEVGPGLGALTEKIASVVKRIVAVEKDEILVHFLENKFVKNKKFISSSFYRPSLHSRASPSVTTVVGGVRVGQRAPHKERKSALDIKIVHQDILKIKEDDLLKLLFDIHQNKGYKIIANLPYYLTARFIRRFLTNKLLRPELLVLVVQKEVAERITALKGAHSLLSLSCQFYSRPRIYSYISRDSFYPKPKVDSAILVIKPYKTKLFKDIDERLFFKVIRACFLARRKQIHNNLAKGFSISPDLAKELLQRSRISSSSRAQDLSLSDWKNLTKLIHKEID